MTTNAVSQRDTERDLAAMCATELIEPGMTVGLGTGSTVGHLLPLLASRHKSIRCVATSPRTETAALSVGLVVVPFDDIDRFDITIDGADQIAPNGWVVKGGGAAHTREKIIAAASDRFVIIADEAKAVPAIHGPIPVEVLAFGLAATRRRLAPLILRETSRSPDGGVIADYHGEVSDPANIARMLSNTTGVIEHGLFPPNLITDIIVGANGSVRHRRLHHARAHLEPPAGG